MRAALAYAVGYWKNVSWVAFCRACAAIGWNHPRNAILPLAVSLVSAGWVGYEQHDYSGFITRAMIAGAAFATFIAFGVLAFIYQMIATPPRIDAEKAIAHSKEYEPLKAQIAELSQTLASVKTGPTQPSPIDRRFEYVRSELQKHADSGSAVEIKADMVAWMQAAETLIRGLAPRQYDKLWRAYPSGADAEEILSSQEIAALHRSIASLKVIAGNLSASDLA
jgi:hypothetical protein